MKKTSRNTPKMIDDLRRRAASDDATNDLLIMLDDMEKVLGEDKEEPKQGLRLPYSSDPLPIEKGWN